MSKKKPESLTERQHFLIYQYEDEHFKKMSHRDLHGRRAILLANISTKAWGLISLIAIELAFLFTNLINDGWLLFPILFFLFEFFIVMYYADYILHKRLKEEWKDVPVIGEYGEPISKAEGDAHA